ncbi:MAG: hypothetical protein M3Y85_03325 [Bacteroidota bacterium]|nr:hypothetical protein [Bacteroidota bacterium]
MKKFLGILILAGVFTACNNTGSDMEKKDSTTVTTNTTVTTPVPVDNTTVHTDSTVTQKMSIDTSHH